MKFVETKVDASRILCLDGESGGRWLISLDLRGEVSAKVSPAVGSVGDTNDLIFNVRANEGGREPPDCSGRLQARRSACTELNVVGGSGVNG